MSNPPTPTTQQTMRELIARAMATADEQNGGPPWDLLMTMGKHVVGATYDAADAAMAAMHDPTQAMLDAARDWSRAKYGKSIGDDAARGCWVAMLEAAINGN